MRPASPASGASPASRRSPCTPARQPDPTTGARAVPIYQTTSYVFKDADHAARLFGLQEPGNIYTRIMNPTTDVLEQRVAALEGGVGAPGLRLRLGRHHLRHPQHRRRRRPHRLGQQPLRRHATTCSCTPCRSSASSSRSSTPPTRRTSAAPSTPRPSCSTPRRSAIPSSTRSTSRAVADVAHEAGMPLIVDNTMPTPYLIRPIEHGADIVVPLADQVPRRPRHLHRRRRRRLGQVRLGGRATSSPASPSPTRATTACGSSRPLGAAAYIVKLRVSLLRDIGAAISPFNAFLILQGIETLPLRMERHSANALAVARFLEQPSQGRLGELPGPASRTRPMRSPRSTTSAASTAPWSASASRAVARPGGASWRARSCSRTWPTSATPSRSVIHPATTTHSQLTPEEQLETGVTDDFVRLSIGIESIDDIIADIDQALAKA